MSDEWKVSIEPTERNLAMHEMNVAISKYVDTMRKEERARIIAMLEELIDKHWKQHEDIRYVNAIEDALDAIKGVNPQTQSGESEEK